MKKKKNSGLTKSLKYIILKFIDT